MTKGFIGFHVILRRLMRVSFHADRFWRRAVVSPPTRACNWIRTDVQYRCMVHVPFVDRMVPMMMDDVFQNRFTRKHHHPHCHAHFFPHKIFQTTASRSLYPTAVRLPQKTGSIKFYTLLFGYPSVITPTYAAAFVVRILNHWFWS